MDFGSGEILNKMRYRPLPPPPRPPRDKKQRKSPKPGTRDDDDDKFYRGGGGERLTAPYLDDSSRISSQEIEETEAGTQTDPLPADFSFEEFEITDDMRRVTPSHNADRTSKTIEDLLRESQEAERIRHLESEQNLAKSINKFRDANQRRTSERSRTSGGSRGSRPITPSAMVIESRIIVSTDSTDAALIVAPIHEAENRPLDYRTDSKESEDVPYLDDNVTTEDERIVSEAIRRYQLLDPQFKESSSQPSADSSRHDLDHLETDLLEDEALPLPPPRRKSSTVDGLDDPLLATPEEVKEPSPTPSTEVAKIKDNHVVNATPSEQTIAIHGGRLQIDELEVNRLNVRALQAGQILVSDLHGASITTDELDCRSGNITVRGIDLPVEFIQSLVDRSTTRAAEIVSEITAPPSPPVLQVTPQTPTSPTDVTDSRPIADQKPTETTGPGDEPPERPPPPQNFFPSDFAPYSIPPPAFYQLRNPESEQEELLRLHSATAPTHRRPRRHQRHSDSTSEEEYQRERRHRRDHSGPSTEPSILDLSGQLIRACGSAIGNTLQTASNSVANVLLTSDASDEKRRNVNIVLIILVIILAVLIMLGLSGGRAIHHHHWDFLNPPKNAGL